MIWPRSAEQQALNELYGMNLTEEQLRERFIRPYETGAPITWGGRTLPGGDISSVNVAATPDEMHVPRNREYETIFRHAQDSPVAMVRDVTNDWISGAPGESVGAARAAAATSSERGRDTRRVMVVYGRNLSARNAMFSFLRALGLRPIEWEQAVAETGRGSPHNLEAVAAAMTVAQAAATCRR